MQNIHSSPFNPYVASAPPLYPAAPPAYPSQAPSAPRQDELVKNSNQFNPHDECSFCLEEFKDTPQGAQNNLVAKTACNHFLHNFCLKKHLEGGVNQDCPLCREPIDSNRISYINQGVKANSVESKQNQEAPKNSDMYSNLINLAVMTGYLSKNALILAGKGILIAGKGIVYVATKAAEAMKSDPDQLRLQAFKNAKNQQFFIDLNSRLEESYKNQIKALEREREEIQMHIALLASTSDNRSESSQKKLESESKFFSDEIEKTFKIFQSLNQTLKFKFKKIA